VKIFKNLLREIKVKYLIFRYFNIVSRKEPKQRMLIDSTCIGYSRQCHWNMFKAILSIDWIQEICLLGVYFGRDIAYIASILKNNKRDNYRIIGIDKFEDTPGADWPQHLTNLSWEEAGMGQAPNIDKAQENLVQLGIADNVALYKGLAENALDQIGRKFDFIYVDVSHDYETTMRVIQSWIKYLRRGALIGGDDFSNEGTWGVERAVRDSFSNFELFDGYMWLALRENYKFRDMNL
jgi:hypothetical protein